MPAARHPEPYRPATPRGGQARSAPRQAIPGGSGTPSHPAASTPGMYRSTRPSDHSSRSATRAPDGCDVVQSSRFSGSFDVLIRFL